ncbi:zinc ribbon-containing protein [Yersinia pseudotuberculosis]|uniref:zinc ribbon-containing protein n=1 Tax=Yersinia pseudotuberculosis TaxID=633 RepID=UPI002239362F|nr:hypothetical protein [Yersinia pseudotuberculosis]
MTDKTQLEWREVFKDVSHHGFITVVKLLAGNCLRKMPLSPGFYTPEVLPVCPKCGHDQLLAAHSSHDRGSSATAIAKEQSKK